ncbi:Gfo/Idh/MocA family protein [Sporomusa acidovorans]|uniref:Inositol 2-dehydrogenase/D-chiro-inositol 3-dehydrogenase n=1 Tax=Sporomusa acidovorans (strain ATCC 49682 / DSM 3132 / Mol) TaxID=1123286 RepID=A0ABZ3IZF3_SPOA4|nr:Gfo/Idh/MocA family oxidoreductase [Sporomusa acidovorans]OZC22886.1 scyllo-inositol 2-dehydrogenase (NAD(+)) [Sporomusa acidovorans DSM 3132]SDF73967.1 Predicted dehydrogenase [Sporomusa acidovorans]
MVRIGLVGCGAWGFNYINTLCFIPEVKLQSICDIKEESLQKVRKNYPNIRTTTDYRELLNDDQLDGVIIATPPHSHFSIAAEFLSQHKAVLVEKPCTLSYHEADALIKLAEKKNIILMVGHLMEYHPVVFRMQEHISQGRLGQLRYIFLERTSLGKIRNEVSVHWDLTVHDLSMVRYLVNKNPRWVSAYGVSYQQQNIYDLVSIIMEFPGDLFVQIHANRISPIKKRQAVIAGDQMTAVFDDVKDADKLQLISHSNEIIVPMFEKSLPLTNQCRHFVDCIKTKLPPRTGSADILWVMKVTELVEQSLLANGAKLYWNGNGETNVKDRGI